LKYPYQKIAGSVSAMNVAYRINALDRKTCSFGTAESRYRRGIGEKCAHRTCALLDRINCIAASQKYRLAAGGLRSENPQSTLVAV